VDAAAAVSHEVHRGVLGAGGRVSNPWRVVMGAVSL
jgi:hypothetical protein